VTMCLDLVLVSGLLVRHDDPPSSGGCRVHAVVYKTAFVAGIFPLGEQMCNDS
jgi:hypothetical protein